MANPRLIESAIQRVRDQASFIQDLLVGALEWPIEDTAGQLDDITFEWSAEELRAEGIDKKIVAGLVRQIRPFPGNPWGIFILEFKRPDLFATGRGMTGILRRILRGLVPKQRAVRDPALAAFNRENLLFICTHNYEHYRFAYFKAPRDGVATAPLAAFGWSPGDPIRTLCEFNLSALAWPGAEPASEAAWVNTWAAAFDIEKVTKRFYEDYRQVFEEAEKRIARAAALKPEEVRLFAQSLFNRLMFLRFIERKAWLNFPGQQGRNYLAALIDAGPLRSQSFYQSRIRPLFFEGMALDGKQNAPSYGSVPFLNGGLFEESDLDRKVKDLPDALFGPIIARDGLFYRYNFTIEESTPLDIEVAVDPEMLGKVFEELVTGRHETGSYYTPRPVVSFMCREALKGYIRDKTQAPEAAIQRLVDEHRVEGLNESHANQIEDALDALKAVDPACGSGAYLLGLLHELVAIRRALQSERIAADPKFLYERKLHIISHNLYGVDIDPFATEIAKLRLWLSLAVDTDTPVPLPNLDFKIETGDSLLGPNPEVLPDDMFRHQLETWANALVDLKDKYLRARGAQKLALRDSIAKYERRIADMLASTSPKNVIEWRVHFAEVFGKSGGFDMVLANPPYVRQELIREIKPTLKTVYADLYCGTADLYYYFYLRSLQVLRPGGMLAFISSNKWFRANYGANLRAHIARTCNVRSITDFGDLPVFDSATAYPMIFVAQRMIESETSNKSENRGAAETLFTEVPTLDPPYPDVRALVDKHGVRLPSNAIDGPQWTLAGAQVAGILQKMKNAGIPLGEYVNGRFYYGIKTGLNAAFVVDRATRDRLIREHKSSAEILKPFLRGRDVKRWNVEPQDLWLIFIPWHFPLHDEPGITGASAKAEAQFNKGYPAIYKHLSQFKEELSARNVAETGIRYEWYALQRWGADYRGEFEQTKIIYPNICARNEFAWDESRFHANQKTFIITGGDKFLLAVLNSSVVTWLFAQLIPKLQNGFFEPGARFLREFPIPAATPVQQKPVERLVERILSVKQRDAGADVSALEREIDELVYALYGLTPEEIAVVEESVK